MDILQQLKNRYIFLTLIFCIAFSTHLIGINKIGRTWDEQFKVDGGYVALDNLTSGNFSVEAWDFVIEHPMVGKYIYGFFMGPHTIRIDDGNGNIANISPLDIEAITNGNYIKTQLGNKLYMISYDLTTPKLVSALANSLAVTLTVFLALFFLTELWAFMAGLFLLVIPRFVVMGQLITFESLTVFFFILTLIVFYKLLNNPKKLKYYLLTGMLCGLLFWTRYNNYFIFVFLAGWMLIHYYFNKKKEIFNLRLILIPLIAFVLGIVIWPITWHDFPKYLIESFTFHNGRIIPSIYYLNRLIFTTPIPILFGLIIGLVYSFRERKYWQIFSLWWFFSVLLINMIIGVPGGGTRYIMIIYPAIGILCAYGYSQILKKKWIFALIPIFAFMIIEMMMYFPYYLDYYNSLIGGVNGAKQRSYEFSWWGEGQREVGMYINKNLPQNSTLSLFVIPKYVFPSTRIDIKNSGFLDDGNTDAQYVVVSSGLVNSLSKKFLESYEIIYASKVRGESLVLLYKKK